MFDRASRRACRSDCPLRLLPCVRWRPQAYMVCECFARMAQLQDEDKISNLRTHQPDQCTGKLLPRACLKPADISSL